MSLVMRSSAQPCVLHRTHSPRNLTVEFHHVIPVAWQLKVSLTGAAPSPGPDPDGRGQLWDNRGDWLCPTGHRNTHAWIVKLMRAAGSLHSDDPQAALKAVKPRSAPVELAVAFEALSRFMAEAGGPLSVELAGLLWLALHGLWGEA